MHCGAATPTDPGVPPRTTTTGAIEVAQVTQALAGRYRIESVVGEGGMATVYLAEDLRHKRKVAVKVMRPELAATLGADRFLREVEIAAKLHHPHILPLYDSGESGGMLFYVMPLVEGESLKDRLAREGALAPDEALKLGREIAEALAYAHKRGIVHRDIKPANILLSDGHAYVADFGIARALGDGGTEALTKTGLAVGTPQYMAPEQATGEKDVDGRADVYAAGAILYEMLAGQPPFTGQNARAVLTRSLTEAPRPLHAVKPTLTPALDAVVQRALRKSADERFATAEQFALAIDGMRARTSGTMPAVTSGELEATQVTPAAPAGGGARPAWLSPRNLLVAGLAAAALFFALRGRGAAPAAEGRLGNRVALLPFRHDGPAGVTPVVDGVLEDVRTRLGSVSSLQAIGAISANEYRGSDQDPRAIGRELTADYLLTGTVRWSGDGPARTVRVEPRLVATRTGEVLWDESITMPDSMLPAVPPVLAGGVLRALAVTPTAAESVAVARRLTTRSEAYRAFLRGQQGYLYGAFDPQQFRAVIQELEQAVALDGEFAVAWAWLGLVNGILYSQGNRDPAVATRARAAVERAEALEPEGAWTYVARGVFLQNVQGDAPAAASQLDRALRAAPNDVAMLRRSGQQHLQRGDLGAALTTLERARDLDPRDPNTLTLVVSLQTALGQLAKARTEAERLVELAPQDLQILSTVLLAFLADGDLEGARRIVASEVDHGVPLARIAAHVTGYYEIAWLLAEDQQRLALQLPPSAFDNDRAWWAQSLATLHWQRGDTTLARAFADSAIGPTRRQVAEAPSDAQLRVLLALVLAYAGRAGEARTELAAALERVAQSTDNGYILLNAARTELALGDRDAAIAHLRQIMQRGYFVRGGWLAIDPTFASLKGYPPFDELLARK
jgi:serine/threonine-protein kinase